MATDRRRLLRRGLVAVVAVVAVAGAAVAAARVYLRSAPRPPDTTKPACSSGAVARSITATCRCSTGRASRQRRYQSPTRPDAPGGPSGRCRCWRPAPNRFPPEAPDLRGLWLDGNSGHLERVEQCGDRVVVTSVGLIHDMRADGSLGRGANDVNLSCMRIRNRTRYRDGVLQMDGYGMPWVPGRALDGGRRTALDASPGWRTPDAAHLPRACGAGDATAVLETRGVWPAL